MHLAMVPLTINLIYEVHSGYFLCIRYTVYHIPLLKGSNRGVKQNSQGTIPRGPHHFPYDRLFSICLYNCPQTDKLSSFQALIKVMVATPNTKGHIYICKLYILFVLIFLFPEISITQTLSNETYLFSPLGSLESWNPKRPFPVQRGKTPGGAPRWSFSSYPP